MNAPEFVNVSIGHDYVAFVEINRPPHNHFNSTLVGELADVFEALDEDTSVRASVLCATGKHFCAGADLTGPRSPAGAVYREGARIFATRKPIVAAVQGAAIGGGLGVALVADFRVASPEARFASNFARLGFHHGFGLSVTLPELVGKQFAADMMYTGRRVRGEEAFEKGLVDRLVPIEQLRQAAHELAVEIARSAPLAVRATRATLRGDLAERVVAAMEHESKEQAKLRATEDYPEGVKASAERRLPDFKER